MKTAWRDRALDGTYKIDASKKPKQIDITIVENKKKKVVQTIYELDGDTLKIALPFDEVKGRLTSFDSKKALILIMKHDKK